LHLQNKSLFHNIYQSIMNFNDKNTYRNYMGSRQITTGVFFLAFFLYFFILNRYILLFQEQNQLFRFSKTYFADFLSRPGGISEYAGEFLTQFFLFPVAGPIILSFVAFLIFIVTVYIFEKHNIKGIIYSFIPVLFMAGLHSHYLFKIGFSFGFLFSVVHFALFISLKNNRLRYLSLGLGLPVLFFVSGGYALFSAVLCLLHELLYNKGKLRLLTSSIIIILAAIIPYLSSNIIFFIPTNDSDLYLIPFFIKPPLRYILILFLIYFPLALIIKRFLPDNFKYTGKVFSQKTHFKTSLAGVFVIIIISVVIFRITYDRKTELLLGMDHYSQSSEWERVLELSDVYPDTNRLVMFYTNLAHYKTGDLSNHLFEYPQVGREGLWLDWKPDGTTSFFGCNFLYDLGYTNEAYRWAFEAMVANGPNPRSMKLLATTSLLNNDLPLARKYLWFLDQSLFYRRWAKHYNEMVSDPFLITVDPVLSLNRTTQVHTDFFANNNFTNIHSLLINNPGNKMAFEYFMASFLLEGDLKGFSSLIGNIKNYDYKRLPVNYEEALIFYSSYEKQNFVPEGFSLSQETIKRFQNFAATFVRYETNPVTREKELKRKFGNTYWYYLHTNETYMPGNEKQF